MDLLPSSWLRALNLRDIIFDLDGQIYAPHQDVVAFDIRVEDSMLKARHLYNQNIQHTVNSWIKAYEDINLENGFDLSFPSSVRCPSSQMLRCFCVSVLKILSLESLDQFRVGLFGRKPNLLKFCNLGAKNS
jgi:hypothetical protein